MAASAAAQPYKGPPTSGTHYWEEPAFSDIPVKGPNDATGVIFWSHGLAGDGAQWQYPPPPVIKDIARTGWDVIKVQRNPLNEYGGWDGVGQKHVADLVERIEKANRAGYKQVVAAGQSYGGALSLEAAGKTNALTAVFAAAPGHGSDACNRTGAYSGRFWRLPELLADAIGKATTTRLAVMMADGDECMGAAKPHATIRKALAASPSPHTLFLDETMPVRGHGAAGTAQFALWYGKCLADFLDTRVNVEGKSIPCAAPNPAPRFVWPAGYNPALFPASDPARALGPWSGQFFSDPPDGTWGIYICTVVEQDMNDRLETTMAFDAGPEWKMSTSSGRRSLVKEGKYFIYKATTGYYRMRYELDTQRGEGTLLVTSAGGEKTWTIPLKRGCPN
jgi:dienelactone hydrolase